MQDKLNPQADFSNPNSPSIYVHVPFCARPCAYCKFYKQRPTAGDISDYLDVLELEVRSFFQRNENVKPLSIFFGGGTPTSLNIAQLERLCEIFTDFAPVGEWTIEASPSTIDSAKLRALKDVGVNRLSLGVQSFDESTLKILGRAHSVANAMKAIDAGLSVFENMNIDLIFGSLNQTEEMWRADLARAVSYPFKHISAYCLEFESATSCCAGVEKPIDAQEKEIEFLEIAMESLQHAGFSQYEISNYAQKGWECVQNINTWRMGTWVGFGPSAASQFGGMRYQNPMDLNAWIKHVNNNSASYENIVRLDDNELYSSALIFGLRMRSGVDLPTLKRRFPNADFARHSPAIKNLADEGLLELHAEILKLTEKGIPYADSIGSEFV